MLFIGSPSNLFLRLQKKREILRNLFLRLEEFGNICSTNFCDLGPKSQKFVPKKLMPQHFMPAKINAFKVAIVTTTLPPSRVNAMKVLIPKLNTGNHSFCQH